ncbi:MAG TPA: imidazole glycerol phosphate synthase subunit HisH [Elusimicrobiota bacterium]|nr:imidazole glycerol phosphate synthase subunit HisH [Elusimicrobiota bacterium]
MRQDKIVIVDYRMGNLFNLQRAITFLGYSAEITSDPAVIRRADRILLPGVGAFEKAMQELDRADLIGVLKESVDQGKMMLGICLGMQLLFTKSFEFGEHRGLDFIRGQVVRFHRSESEITELKIPQIGWNSVEKPSAGPAWEKGILASVSPGTYFYFVHSFVCCPEEPAAVVAETQYGKDRFCSVTHRGNLWGCQFHPERSGEHGLSLLKSFIEL